MQQGKTHSRRGWASLGLATLAACGSVNKAADGGAGGDSGGTIDGGGAIDGGGGATCGDGRRDPGEVCFGPTTSVIGTDVTYDGQLADFDADGDLDLVYLIGDQLVGHPLAAGQFAPTALSGQTVVGVALLARDLNGDNRADYVVAGPDNTRVLRQEVGFAQTIVGDLPALLNPLAAFIADVDGNGRDDVVIGGSRNIAVYDLGTNLSLTSQRSEFIQPTVSMAVGRLDEDNQADAVAAGPDGIRVYRANTPGAPNAFTTLASPLSGATQGVAIGQVDGTGANDVLYVQTAAAIVGVLRGAGAGGFLAPQPKPVDGVTAAMTATDHDGDGRADLLVVVATQPGGQPALAVLLGQADGSLADPVFVPLPQLADRVIVGGDVNGDGGPDVVATHINTQTVTVIPTAF